LWLPVVLWAGAIFAASSVSQVPALPTHVTDKMVHAAIYGVLGAACLRALAGGRWSGVSLAVAAGSVLAATAYGATDEFHQWFVPGRSADVQDLLADLMGSASAATVILAVGWLRRRREARI
jgi:VanZ family protein